MSIFLLPFFGLLLIIPLTLYILNVYCWYRIMQKAGYGNLGLLAIFAPATVVLIIILAFGPWHDVKDDGIRYEKINPVA